MKRPAFFLDRDGVINQSFFIKGKPRAPLSFQDFQILPKVKEALEMTRKAGYLNLVITNQPEIRKGRLPQSELDQMHQFMMENLCVDHIEFCPHTDEQKCRCRKPLPGMIESHLAKHEIDMSQSWLVGDRWRDIELGIAMSLKTAFIDYDYPEQKPTSDLTDTSLFHIVQNVINSSL